MSANRSLEQVVGGYLLKLVGQVAEMLDPPEESDRGEAVWDDGPNVAPENAEDGRPKVWHLVVDRHGQTIVDAWFHEYGDMQEVHHRFYGRSGCEVRVACYGLLWGRGVGAR